MRNSSDGDQLLYMLEIIPDFVMGSNDSILDQIHCPFYQNTGFRPSSKLPYRTSKALKTKSTGGGVRFFYSILEGFDGFMNFFKSFSVFNASDGTQISRAVTISHLQSAELPMEGKRCFSRTKISLLRFLKQLFQFCQFLLAKSFGIIKLQGQSKPAMGFKRNLYKRFKDTSFKNNRDRNRHFYHRYKHNTLNATCQDLGCMSLSTNFFTNHFG